LLALSTDNSEFGKINPPLMGVCPFPALQTYLLFATSFFKSSNVKHQRGKKDIRFPQNISAQHAKKDFVIRLCATDKTKNVVDVFVLNLTPTPARAYKVHSPSNIFPLFAV